MTEVIRVLIIEDNKFVRDVLRDCTTGLTCSFTEVENETEALERIRTEDFDVIFLDLGLPEGDGLETFRKAKEMRADLPPVVVLTGHRQEARRKKAEELGVFDYLTKDQLSTEEITSRIRIALESRRLHGKQKEDTHC